MNRGIVRFSPHFLLTQWKGKFEIIKNPVPDGVRVLRYGCDDRCFFVEFEGENVPDSPDGSPVELNPLFKRID